MHTLKHWILGTALLGMGLAAQAAKPPSSSTVLPVLNTCSTSDVSGTGMSVLGCLGQYTGNLNNNLSFDSVKALIESQWSGVTLGSAILSQANNSEPERVASFLQGASGQVVLGIHWGGQNGGQTSFYHLSLDSNFTGSFSMVQNNPNGFSNIALYKGTFTTPVPEPQTPALMLAGLGVMGFLRARRQSRP